MIWSGASNAIPGGWALCDGLSGRPDLRDRFVIGAGSSYAVNATGGSKNAVVVTHYHTASFSNVTLPAHQHDSSWGESNTRNAPFGVSGRTNGQGSGDTDTDNYGWLTSSTLYNTGTISGSVTVDNAGSSGTDKNLPPYYALCYIIKI